MENINNRLDQEIKDSNEILVSIPAAENTLGTPGGSYMERGYFVRR
jgi:hypothetical protein